MGVDLSLVPDVTPGDRRVALVTGGGAGIGRATVRRLTRAGLAVGILEQSPEAAEAAWREVLDAGGEALYHVGDVRHEADHQAVARAALKRWGRIDVLVANAASILRGSLLEATDAEWETVVQVNLMGVVYACRAVLPAMVRQAHGSIVVVASLHALVGRADWVLYDATKAAVVSLARSLAAAHGADGVRVNAVCPGLTITDYQLREAAAQGVSPQQLRTRHTGYGLLGRPAEASEVAAAIWFLASDDAAMITGQALLVDGGRSVV